MTSLSKISPLGHVNYAIKSLLNVKNNLDKAIDGLPKDKELKKALALVENIFPLLEKKSSKLYAIKRPYTFRVRPPRQLIYTLDEALDNAAIVADPLRKRVYTMIEIVMLHHGLDYAVLTSGRRDGRIAQAKKTIAIGLKRWLGIPSNDVRKLLSISVNTIDYHCRTEVLQDTEAFETTFNKIKNGEYWYEHQS